MRPPQPHGPWERALRQLPAVLAGVATAVVAFLLVADDPSARGVGWLAAAAALLGGVLGYQQGGTDSEVARLGAQPGWTFHRYPAGRRPAPCAGAPFGEPAWMTAAADRVTAGGRLTVFHFTSGLGRAARPSAQVCVATTLPAAWPSIELRPRDDALPDALTGHDLAFESEEFNRAYRVSAADRRAACLLLHPRAIEALLAAPPCHLAIRGRVLLAWLTGPDAFELLALADAVAAVAAQAPAAV